MQNVSTENQVQNLDRDAAAQISGEANQGSKQEHDDPDQDLYAKANAIFDGAQVMNGTPNLEIGKHDWYSIAYNLSITIQHLTSTSKEHREYAKKKVRKLVKLGKEAG